MPGTMIPWFRQQWLDLNGAPLSGGSLETYETGTSTPLATYSDAALTVTNGTTITLNAGGFPTVTGVEVGIFLLPRAYRFVLKDSAGATQRTIDGVYAVQAASSVNLEIDGVAGEALSANNVVYLSDGSGGQTAGRWYKADADLAYASLTAVIGFAVAAIAQGATGTIRVGGTLDGFGGLVAGSTYYVSATAGAITAVPPTNARVVGVATSATTIVMDVNAGVVWLPDSDGTHRLLLRTSSNLTANRTLTIVTGDADVTLTFPTVQTTTATGTQNDFAATAARYLLLRCNNATLLTLTGFAAGTAGDIIDVVSVGAGQVNFSHQTGSTAANQLFNIATTGPTSLAAGSGTARYVYDGTTARWRLLNHEQGAAISVAFSAGNYTASAGAWTVAVGDQLLLKYRLSGRVMTVFIDISTSTVTAGAADLILASPLGFTIVNNHFGELGQGVDNGGTPEPMQIVPANTNQIFFRLLDASSWAISADTTACRGTAVYEVA